MGLDPLGWRSEHGAHCNRARENPMNIRESRLLAGSFHIRPCLVWLGIVRGEGREIGECLSHACVVSGLLEERERLL